MWNTPIPKNGLYIYAIPVLRSSLTLSAKTINSYPLPQFCCIINIGNLWYGLCFQDNSSLEEALELGSRSSHHFYLFLARLVQGFPFLGYQLLVLGYLLVAWEFLPPSFSSTTIWAFWRLINRPELAEWLSWPFTHWAIIWMHSFLFLLGHLLTPHWCSLTGCASTHITLFFGLSSQLSWHSWPIL